MEQLEYYQLLRKGSSSVETSPLSTAGRKWISSATEVVSRRTPQSFFLTLVDGRQQERQPMHRCALREEQWLKIKGMLPSWERQFGGTAPDIRSFGDTAIFRYRTSIPWRDLPGRYRHSNSTHNPVVTRHSRLVNPHPGPSVRFAVRRPN
jgi:Putative transposase of IS4/5 family (DUF4096)